MPLAVAMLLASTPSVALQNVGSADEAAKEIVVTARRSGAPMWRITSGETTLLLVGEIVEVPKSTPWFPDKLQSATMRSGRVILGTKATIGFGDVFRLLFRGGRLRRLPDGHTVGDYLSPDEHRRLAALLPDDKDFEHRNMLITAFQLLTRATRFNRNTTDDATDVVRRAASRAHIPARPVGVVRGRELLDSLFDAAPGTHASCLRAAIAAAEEGPAGVERRGRAWTGLDVPRVIASPIETAVAQCWPWGEGGFGGEIRLGWSAAVDDALARRGVTLAVVPLRLLAERDGVLDRLSGRGLRIAGPAWRADRAEPAR